MDDLVEVSAPEFQESIATAVARGVAPLIEAFQGWLASSDSARAHAEEHARRAADLEVALATTEARVADVEKSLAERNRLRAAPCAGAALDHWPLEPRALRRSPRDDDERQAQLLSDALLITAHFAKDRVGAARALLDEMQVAESSPVRKALDTYTASGGAEWIPTVMSSQFVVAVDYRTVVKPLFPTIPMVGKNVTLPGGDGDAEVYRLTGAENTAPTESTKPSTRKVDFSAEDLAARRSYSDNLDQDSMVSSADYLRDRLAAGLARNLDLACLDGDTSPTHQDSDVTASTDPRKMWIGLRKKARTDSGANVDLGTLNLDNLLTMPAGMQQFADYGDDLVWIFAARTYWSRLLTLRDASDNPAFLPAYAPGVQSPVVTGQIGWLAGVPVVRSGLVRTNLNASGVYDATTTDNTVCYLVNRSSWLMGERREITFESDKDITTGTFRLVIRWRGDFQHMQGTGLSTAMGYNIAV